MKENPGPKADSTCISGPAPGGAALIEELYLDRFLSSEGASGLTELAARALRERGRDGQVEHLHLAGVLHKASS